jgi:hypothetical protein
MISRVDLKIVTVSLVLISGCAGGPESEGNTGVERSELRFGVFPGPGATGAWLDRGGNCFGITHGSNNVGTRVITTRCRGHQDQLWFANPIPDAPSGYTAWVTQQSKLCMDTATSSNNGNPSPGAAVVQWLCNPVTGEGDQLWQPIPAYGGSYQLQNLFGGQCLTVPDFFGDNLEMGPCSPQNDFNTFFFGFDG